MALANRAEVGGHNFTADYSPEYGAFSADLSNGTTVHGVSAHDWKEFEEVIYSGLPGDGVVVSPELITAPVDLGVIDAHVGESEARLREMRALSAHTGLSMIIGAATRDPWLPKEIKNTAVVISSGDEVARYDKRYLSFVEYQYDHLTEGRRVARSAVDGVVPMTCIELLFVEELVREGVIPADATALSVSATWGVSDEATNKAGFLPDDPEQLRQHYLTVLENSGVVKAFNALPDLQDVVVVDRTPEGSPIVGQPLNGHYKRGADS